MCGAAAVRSLRPLRAVVVPGWLAEVVRPRRAPVPWPEMARAALAICVLLPATGGLLGTLADTGGPYLTRVKRVCSAAVFGDLVFLSGTVADDKSLDMKGQTAQVLQKIDAVLAKAGTNKSRILSATVYMADASLKDEMNEAWMAWVDRSNLPTRTAVGAALTPGTLVEITVCAAK